MSKIFGNNVLRTSAFALACLALVGADVKANGMSSSSSTGYESYYTLGSVGTTGVTGAPAIGFSAVGNNTSAPKTYGTFSLNSQVSLGGFTVAAPTTTGGTTSYKDTPFTIAYTPVSITGASASQFPNTTILITGLLNGDVTANSSTVKATFNPVKSSVFSTSDGNFVSTFSMPNGSLSLVPSTTFNGLSTLQAEVVTTSASALPPSDGTGGPTPTPEPTTLAILATAFVGLGLRQRLRSSRLSA